MGKNKPRGVDNTTLAQSIAVDERFKNLFKRAIRPGSGARHHPDLHRDPRLLRATIV